MAEIGLVASVVQIADTGIKLSITLYTFAETVLTADKSIKEIASDVSLTSSVLEELGQNLKKDQKSRLCSENAVKTAEGIVKECAAIFNEINGTLETTLEKIKPRAGSEKANGRDGAYGGRKLPVAAYERLKWPFLQPKMQLLRSNLDRLKSTLVLMLNVITYARKVSEEYVRSLVNIACLLNFHTVTQRRPPLKISATLSKTLLAQTRSTPESFKNSPKLSKLVMTTLRR